MKCCAACYNGPKFRRNMKKLFLLPALTFFASFFLASTVLATSGCCSGHSGVNCAAGAQGNGHVICNDGWTGSSCSYASMVMCGGSTSNSTTTNTYVAPTPTPTPVYIAPIVTIKPTSTPTPTFTPTPTETPTPSPTIAATPTPLPVEASAKEGTPTPIVKGASTELPVWKFHWWNFSPLMGLLGSIFQWK